MIEQKRGPGRPRKSEVDEEIVVRSDIACEYTLCLEDFERFCLEAIVIKYKNVEAVPAKLRDELGLSVDQLKGPFVLNDEQRKLADWIIERLRRNEPVKVIILKARQIGFSTLIAALFLFLAHVRPGFGSFIVAQDANGLGQMVDDTYRVMIEEADPAHFLKWSRKPPNGWKFVNGSRVNIRTAGTKQVARKIGRGVMNHGLHLSEMAFYESAAETLLAVSQTFANKGACLFAIECTANATVGIGEEFYLRYKKARDTQSEWKAWFVAWWQFSAYRKTPPEAWEKAAKAVLEAIDKGLSPRADDKYEASLQEDEIEWLTSGIAAQQGQPKVKLSLDQIWWRRACIDENCGGDPFQFDQEYPRDDETAFVVSGKPVFTAAVLAILRQLKDKAFPGSKLQVVRDKERYELVEPTDPLYEVEVWKRPEEGHEYIVSCDAADMADCSSAVTVLDRHTGEIVAFWQRFRQPAPVTAKVIDDLGYLYNVATAAVERESGGIGVVELLFSVLNYPKIYMSVPKLRLRDGQEPVPKPGWVTSAESKPLLLSTFAGAVLDGRAILYSPYILEQLAGWQTDKTGKPQKRPRSGQSFDANMATLIAYRVHYELSPPVEVTFKDQIKDVKVSDEAFTTVREILDLEQARSFRADVLPWDAGWLDSSDEPSGPVPWE